MNDTHDMKKEIECLLRENRRLHELVVNIRKAIEEGDPQTIYEVAFLERRPDD